MTPAQLFARAGQALFGTGQDWKAQFGRALMIKSDSIDSMTKGDSRIPPGVWREVADMLEHRGRELPTLRTKALLALNVASFKITMKSFDGTHIVVGAKPGILFEGSLQACEQWVANQMAMVMGAVPTAVELTPSLCCGARGLIGISIEDLATAAGVPVADLKQFESTGQRLNRVSMAGLRAALGNAGVEFLPESEQHGAGLRRRKPEFEVQPFHVYPEGVGFGARYCGQRFRFLVDESVLDDLVRGNLSGDAELLDAANRHRALILQAAERAAATHGGGSYNIRLDHDAFPSAVW
jgi:hypothetical protein